MSTVVAEHTVRPEPSPSSESSSTPSSSSDDGRTWRLRHRALLATTVAIVALALGGGTGVAAYRLGQILPIKKAAPLSYVQPKLPPEISYSPLTGLQVASPSDAQQPVLGVMIENLYPDARPQSGLGQAGVVYEALAEGGITRFLAIFQEPLPPTLGPVRSLRPYYLDWGLEYGIPIAHAGGSQPALAAIKPLGLQDINALAYDGSAFYRSRDRAAPHNLYTTAPLLSALDAKLGFAVAPHFTPLPRKADQAQTPSPHPKIVIPFSGGTYAVQYDFNPASDSYSRTMGGAPHIDRNTGQQISVKNVVVEFVPTTYGIQADGKPETNIQLIGSGQALVFRDGEAVAATWSKSSDTAPTNLTDAGGKKIGFNRGNTWYEVVPVGNAVSY